MRGECESLRPGLKGYVAVGPAAGCQRAGAAATGFRLDRMTKPLTLTLALILLAAPGRAAEPYLNREGHPCSGSYRQSGDFCVPKDEGSAPAVPKPPGRMCPSG